jgi:DNA polymerase III subunit epsilon
MRQIVLDTETTGLDVSQGHRIIEIGAVEIIERRITGKTFQSYLNPERAIDSGAQAVHGISLDFLSDKPRFATVAENFRAFVADSEIIIHNAAFDMGFLERELALISAQPLSQTNAILDSLLLARSMHAGQKNSLDALCRRYDVSNAHRQFHGALLDAQLLAEVYLAMTAGQASLQLGLEQEKKSTKGPLKIAGSAIAKVVEADAQELLAHFAHLERLQKSSQGRCLWLELEPPLQSS